MSSAPRPSSGGGGKGGGGGEGGGKEDTVAKTAGLVVFSGIAMSIIKALTPKFSQQPPPPPSPPPPSQPSPPPPPPPPSQPSPLPPAPPVHDCSKTAAMREDVGSGPLTATQTIEIVQGDTLWGLSRKYGVPINEIKKANGLTGDTIYAGKKLVIP